MTWNDCFVANVITNQWKRHLLSVFYPLSLLNIRDLGQFS